MCVPVWLQYQPFQPVMFFLFSVLYQRGTGDILYDI
jgi:hypothetical protein